MDRCHAKYKWKGIVIAGIKIIKEVRTLFHRMESYKIAIWVALGFTMSWSKFWLGCLECLVDQYQLPNGDLWNLLIAEKWKEILIDNPHKPRKILLIDSNYSVFQARLKE